MKGISIEALVQIAARLVQDIGTDDAEALSTSEVCRRFLQPAGVPAGWKMTMEHPHGSAEEHPRSKHKQCWYTSANETLEPLVYKPGQQTAHLLPHGEDEDGEPLYCKEPSCEHCRPWPSACEDQNLSAEGLPSCGKLECEGCTRSVVDLLEASPESLSEHWQTQRASLWPLGVTVEKPVGRSNRFVSHAWALPFLEVVRCLQHTIEEEHREREPGPIYLWFDALVLNQCTAAGMDKGFSDVFMDLVRECGHTMLVLTPWEQPMVLSRSRCVWEMYCTDKAVISDEAVIHSGRVPPAPDCQLTLCLPDDQQQAFSRNLQRSMRQGARLPLSRWCRRGIVVMITCKPPCRSISTRRMQ